MGMENCLNVLLSHWLIVLLSYCLIVTLSQCLNVSTSPCPGVSLSHSIIVHFCLCIESNPEGTFVAFHLPWQQLRSIWGVWKCSQWMSHAPKHGDRHQKQVSSMFRTKVISLATFWQAEMIKNGHLATKVNLRCLKMVPMDFLYPNP